MKPLCNYLFATASSVALMGSAAAQPPPVMNWAGPYAGINVGVAWNHSSYTDVDFFFFLLPSGPGNNFWSNTQAGATVGGLLGYNWQSGKIVYGIEGDLNWVDGKSSATIPSAVPVIATSDLRWMSTIRGRIGVTYDPSTLYYLTGGLAVARYSDSWGDPAFGGGRFIFSSEFTRTGLTVGGGVEHMFAPHWTGRIEALFTDFGTQTSTVVSGQTYRTQFEHTVTQVRGAFSYKW